MRVYAIIFSAGILTGWLVNGWRIGEQIAADGRDAVQYARSVDLLSREASDLTAERYELQRELSEASGRIIEKEVIRYVENPDHGNCVLPDDFVRIDTEAATGVPSDQRAAVGTDDTAARFTDADLIQVLADRSEICLAEIEKLTALQEWVRGQVELFGGR